MKFSVLMSTYYKCNPVYFERALQSIWNEQSVKPNEIVVVEDGPLTEGLYRVIKRWEKKLNGVFKSISLEKNVGVGAALNIGLEACNCDLIATMDTDDVSLPDRFEKQLVVFKGKDIDACSAWVSEFESDEAKIISHRIVPEKHNEIVRFAKSRNPMNHPASMYKKTSVLNVGGYARYAGAQDWHLFAKMIVNGLNLYNIQEPLVNMRVGGQLEGRRSGLKYAIEEIEVQYEFLTMGFISLFGFIRNLLIRIPVRLMPKRLLGFVYKMIRS